MPAGCTAGTFRITYGPSIITQRYDFGRTAFCIWVEYHFLARVKCDVLIAVVCALMTVLRNASIYLYVSMLAK